MSTREVRSRLRQSLPQQVFVLRPQRLGWLVLHLAVLLTALAGGVWARLRGVELSLWLLSALAPLLGASIAGLAFVAHETLHGAVVRSKRLQRLIGQIAFAPFGLSAELWCAWHNRVHHPHTNVPGADPDAYPTLAEYRSNRAARWAVEIGAPGNARLRGLLTLAVGFSMQGMQILLRARRCGYLNPQRHRRALLASFLLWSLWLTWSAVVGFRYALFLFWIPLLFGNALVMLYIVTNHSLHRAVDEDDPLATALTVTVPRWFAIYSLQFGYHVEHHLFPTVSHVHGPAIQTQLLRLVPERYCHMTLAEAWRRIWNSPRVLFEQVWLLEPHSLRKIAALGEVYAEPAASPSQSRRSAEMESLAGRDYAVAAHESIPPSAAAP